MGIQHGPFLDGNGGGACGGDVASSACLFQPSGGDTFGGRWCALRTKSRNEKALASDLRRMEIGHFLPLVPTARHYGGRLRRVELPLFPGYMFLCGGEAERTAALTTHRVAGVLEAGDQEGLKTDLQRIHRLVSGDEPVDLYPGLREGRRCRVVGGSLVGLEGVVLRRRGVCRVYIALAMLGQSAQVEIDAALLEAID